MVSALRQCADAGELSRVTRCGEIEQMLDELMAQDWVVYAKHCLSHTDSVVDYLARYTHRIAITNTRILNVDEHGVKLRYKDYSDNERSKTMHLDGEEFVRLLPKGFTRIRHYGFLAGCCRARRLAQIRSALDAWDEKAKETSVSEANETPVYHCPVCRIGQLRLIGEVMPHRVQVHTM